MSSPWLTHASALSYTYALGGRRTAMGGMATQSYHYNALGMLDSTNTDDVPHTFQYDAAGRLIHRVTGTGPPKRARTTTMTGSPIGSTTPTSRTGPTTRAGR